MYFQPLIQWKQGTSKYGSWHYEVRVTRIKRENTKIMKEAKSSLKGKKCQNLNLKSWTRTLKRNHWRTVEFFEVEQCRFILQAPSFIRSQSYFIDSTIQQKVNPNSLAPFFVSSLSPRKGRGQKMGVPPGFRTGDPPHHNALFTHGTPPGCRCPGSDFVPIWDPLLWRNRT